MKDYHSLSKNFFLCSTLIDYCKLLSSCSSSLYWFLALSVYCEMHTFSMRFFRLCSWINNSFSKLTFSLSSNILVPGGLLFIAISLALYKILLAIICFYVCSLSASSYALYCTKYLGKTPYFLFSSIFFKVYFVLFSLSLN